MMVDHFTNKAIQEIYYNQILDFILKKDGSISQVIERSNDSLYHFIIIWLLTLHDHIFSRKNKGMGNRSNIEIASDVLEVANGGASKIQIMYRATLSHKQMKEYVSFLSERGLLAYHNVNNQRRKAHVFNTTEKGLRFLEIYHHLEVMIKENNQKEQHQQFAFIQ
jgi:predicted transcriptional regulator